MDHDGRDTMNDNCKIVFLRPLVIIAIVTIIVTVIVIFVIVIVNACPLFEMRVGVYLFYFFLLFFTY